jgi:hypothetical protein
MHATQNPNTTRRPVRLEKAHWITVNYLPSHVERRRPRLRDHAVDPPRPRPQRPDPSLTEPGTSRTGRPVGSRSAGRCDGERGAASAR